MKVINQSAWETKDLKRLCLAVVKKMGSHKDHIIRIMHTHKKYVKHSPECYEDAYSGRANVGGIRITMFVPMPKTKVWVTGSDGRCVQQEQHFSFNSKKFAQVLEHEIGHNFGMRHKEMRNDWWNLPVDYALNLAVLPKAPKPKVNVDIKKVRFEKAKAKVKDLQTKLKRTQTLLKKWQRKVKHYEHMRTM